MHIPPAVVPWARVWAAEPAVWFPLALSGALYAVGMRRMRAGAGRRRVVLPWRVWCFGAGWSVTALALLSPLHEIAERSFSAHMVQHELLMVVAAPLIVLGRPLLPMLWSLPQRLRRAVGHASHVRTVRSTWRAVTAPFSAWTLHATAIWIWHAPPLFQAALSSDIAHALQHASFLGTALLFWWAVLHGRRGRAGAEGGAAALYVFTTAVHTGALGALLTFSRHVWYPAYGAAAMRVGLTPLADQQLAGLVMWIPGSVVYLAACLWLLASWMAESERLVRRAEQAGARAALERGVVA